MSTNIMNGNLLLLWGGMIPAHATVKYGILPSDDDLTSSNSETEQDDLVYDEHGTSWNIDTCVIMLSIDIDIMYIMYTCLTIWPLLVN